MKKLILFMVLAFSAGVMFGENDKGLWDEAARLYSEKNYEEAVGAYQQLARHGESAPLYYNYANALFKAGYTGKAILYYERALRLDPSNEDIKYNLEFANLSKTDKIDHIEPFFVVVWYRNITNLLTSNMWAYVSLVLFLLAMVMFLVYRFGKILPLRKAAFGLFIAFFAFYLVSMGHALYSRNMVVNNPEAIVMVGSETARSTPDDSGTEVFVIHEGTKVQVKNSVLEWSEVKLEDGKVGWIKTSSFEVI